MQLNLMHLRIGAFVGGIFLVAFMLLARDDRPVVQIDFGMYPDFEGASVLIDGDEVGRLESTGNVPRTGFFVKKGTHKVEVRHPELDSRPTEVALENSTDKARLLLDIGTYKTADGRLRDAIVLQY